MSGPTPQYGPGDIQERCNQLTQEVTGIPSDVKMPKRARIGDIIEIPTSRGLAYVQYTHHDPTHGSLIRVFPGIFDERPNSFTELAKRRARFVAFVPLERAISQKIFDIVGRAPIPEDAQKFPLF
ncbi:MAG TPA: hypothetical protein VKD28_19000, partial [Gemmatimonadales bacterium]|nr:hypothetical protein [Gemmatimonadales bacterium]